MAACEEQTTIDGRSKKVVVTAATAVVPSPVLSGNEPSSLAKTNSEPSLMLNNNGPSCCTGGRPGVLPSATLDASDPQVCRMWGLDMIVSKGRRGKSCCLGLLGAERVPKLFLASCVVFVSSEEALS